MVHGLTPEAMQCRPLRGLRTGTVPVTSGFSGRSTAAEPCVRRPGGL